MRCREQRSDVCWAARIEMLDRGEHPAVFPDDMTDPASQPVVIKPLHYLVHVIDADVTQGRDPEELRGELAVAAPGAVLAAHQAAGRLRIDHEQRKAGRCQVEPDLAGLSASGVQEQRMVLSRKQ